MRTYTVLLLTLAIILFGSCSTVKNVRYFQDLETVSSVPAMEPEQIKIRKGDKISINVTSRDPEMAATFNLRRGTSQNGGSPSDDLGYTVDRNGEINFPVLGRFHVEGLTKEEVGEYVENELIKRSLLKDPIVTTEYQNLGIIVLGEVSSPGRYNIERNNITLLDVLSLAGDLTINGNRNNVLVMREENGKQQSYYVDLRSAKELYASPVYNLQQNDIVYVEPSAKRAREATVNGNSLHTTSFWMSMASFVTSFALLIANNIK